MSTLISFSDPDLRTQILAQFEPRVARTQDQVLANARRQIRVNDAVILEAIRHLESEGLLRREPRGAFVLQ